jgi:hypothetical protein
MVNDDHDPSIKRIERLRERISKMPDSEIRSLSVVLRCRAADLLEEVDAIERQVHLNQAERRKRDTQRKSNSGAAEKWRRWRVDFWLYCRTILLPT